MLAVWVSINHGREKRRISYLPIATRKIDLDRVIQMAWEDRTPFEAIEWQFGLKENDVRALMRRSLKRKSFEMWRKRVKGMGTKHATRRPENVNRFRAPGQRS